MLEHGGRLRQAAQTYGIALQDWLDLSTGVNPYGWPAPAIPADAWLRLPESDDGLEDAARLYYGASSLLPVAGSQAAIQALPWLRRLGRIGVVTPAYAEHAHAWRRAGHEVLELAAQEVSAVLDDLDALVVINPNNPDGLCHTPETLLAWHRQLSRKNGWLIVDEAFIDATPALSLAAYSERHGLIVLRSLGKFFGLAGARVGFVLAEKALLQILADALGPWPISGASRFVARQALLDRTWQQAARERLERDSARLADLLHLPGCRQRGGCALFQWLATPQAAEIHRRLAQRGILARLFHEPAGLRFGLPGNEAGWQRLQQIWIEIIGSIEHA